MASSANQQTLPRGTIGLGIAGLNLKLCLPEAQIERMRPAWAPFELDAQAADALTVDVHQEDEPAANFKGVTRPEIRTNGYKLELFQRRLFHLFWDREARKATLRYRPVVHADASRSTPMAIQGALNALWATWLPLEGGILLHAAGVQIDQRGVLFIGPSGAGKSTLAAMFDASTTLSDELVAITNIETRPTLHATPFEGTLSREMFRNEAPVCMALQIEKAQDVAFLDLPEQDRFRLLMRCVAIPQGAPELEVQIFNRVNRFVAMPIWHRFQFPKTASVVRNFLAARLAEREGG